MNCENGFCIFNKDNKCIFKKISLNQVGTCNNMRLINDNDEIIQKETERIRNLINFANDDSITNEFKLYLLKQKKKTSG